MKLLSIAVARSIWLLPIRDLNPKGKYVEHVLKAITERYSLVKKSNANDSNGKSDDIFLEKGSFACSHGEVIEIALSLHSDGLVAESWSSTSDCDEFLKDLLGWLHTEFDLVQYEELIKRKVYVSEVFVQSDGLLNVINPKLEGFMEELSSSMTGHEPALFEAIGMSFGTDPEGVSRPVPFRVERASGAAFSDNRYYSSGPFKTDIHLSLLEHLENLLT